MKKIRIAIVMPNHFDVESSLLNSLKTMEYLMKQYPIEITLFTDSKNSVSYEKIPVKKIQGIDYGTWLGKVLFVLGIPRFYYRDLEDSLREYDIIQANNPEFYAYAYQAYAIARKYGKPFVLKTSQTKTGFYLYHLTRYLVNPVVKKAYDYASICYFTNPQSEQRAVRLGLLSDTKKSVILGHPTDTKTFRPLPVLRSRKSVILSVGGLYEIKGHHLIMEAMATLVGKGHANVELWIVGKGYFEKRLKERAAELGIENKVKFLGAQGHDALAKIYNQATVFVLANYQEITPAVNEALACDLPVVVMECGGREFVIPNEEYGFVARKFDIDDLAEKILLAITDQKAAQKAAARGKARVLNLFAIEKIAEKMYKAYAKAADRFK